MNEFLLIFRRDSQTKEMQLSPEQMQAMMRPWQEWIEKLAAKNMLIDRGNRLEKEGKVVQPSGAVVNGPYVETKESVGGYMIIRAASLDEAAEQAKACPILMTGGNVEVRQMIAM